MYLFVFIYTIILYPENDICVCDCIATLDLFTTNWSNHRVVVVVVIVGSVFSLMTGCNDENDICIANGPFQQH